MTFITLLLLSGYSTPLEDKLPIFIVVVLTAVLRFFIAKKQKADREAASNNAKPLFVPALTATIKFEISDNAAVITMPECYEISDMIAFTHFTSGKRFHQFKVDVDLLKNIRFILYDCRKWVAFDGLGTELVTASWVHKVADRYFIFCGLNTNMRGIVDEVLGELNVPVEEYDPKRVVFFDTLEEGFVFTGQTVSNFIPV